MANERNEPVLVTGGGIGGLAAALALVREGLDVKVIEQSETIAEVGAGIQLSPNAFAACDALGVGDNLRERAVYTDEMVMLDALDSRRIASISLGEPFRRRFGNPYAVIHRADLHGALLDGVIARSGQIEFLTSTRITSVEQGPQGVTLHDARGGRHTGQAVVAADGVKSVVRQQYVGDDIRVSGHVVYRSVIDTEDFPRKWRLAAPCLWAGPNYHLVHYPLKGGEKFNLAATFHSRHAEEAGNRPGDPAELLEYFGSASKELLGILRAPQSWRRWSTADREPIDTLAFGRAALLGDAAHPMVQYLAQGACMACEDAVTLGMAVREEKRQWERAFAHYERARVARAARVVLSAREMGRLYHAKGIERVVRNDMWRQRTQDSFHSALSWLYSWTADTALNSASAGKTA